MIYDFEKLNYCSGDEHGDEDDHDHEHHDENIEYEKVDEKPKFEETESENNDPIAEEIKIEGHEDGGFMAVAADPEAAHKGNRNKKNSIFINF